MYNNTSKIQTGFKNDPESYWISSTERETYPQLKGKAAADVVVVGAGIFGVTTALFLTEAGFNTVLIEGRRILNGTTGYTTAKVTSQHRMIYDYLITKFGREKALQYANANQAAIEKIAELVEQYNIDCDFLRMGAYVYTESEAFIENIQKEVEAAKSLGIPASYTKDTGLPFTVKCAVRFDRQAQFHPLKYLTALVENAVKKGLISMKTRALSISVNRGIISLIRMNRWSGIWATAAMFAGAEGKKKTLTNLTLQYRTGNTQRAPINPGRIL